MKCMQIRLQVKPVSSDISFSPATTLVFKLELHWVASETVIRASNMPMSQCDIENSQCRAILWINQNS